MIRRILAALSVTIILLACDGQISNAQNASENSLKRPASKQRFIQASDALLAELGKPGERDALPKSGMAIVQQCLVEAKGLTESLGTSDIPANNMNDFDLCERGNKISITYALAGLSKHASKQTPAIELTKIIQKIAEKNNILYYDIIYISALYNQHCIATFMPILDNFFMTLPQDEITDVRLNGLRQTRRGVQQIIQQSLIAVSNPGTTAAGRAQFLSQLETDWGNLLLILSIKDREKLASDIMKVIEQAPADIRDRIKKLNRRIADTKCGSLCSV